MTAHTVAREWLWFCATLLVGVPALYVFAEDDLAFSVVLALTVLYPSLSFLRVTCWAIRQTNMYKGAIEGGRESWQASAPKPPVI